MPAFFDSGEFSANSTMPPQDQFSNLVLIPGLSKLIGGDCLLSTWPAKPRNKKLLAKHLERGAMIVEIKRMADFPGSLLDHRTNHLKKQIIRMQATGAGDTQCVVLYTGLHRPGEDGQLVIEEFNGAHNNWTTTQYDYINFIRTLSRLQDSFPRFEQVPSNDAIPFWVNTKLQDLKEYKTRPVRTVQAKQLPFSKKHLRELKPSEGAQAILALFNDIGPVGSRRIMEYCGGVMAHAIEALTTKMKIDGVRTKAYNSFREQLGLINEWSKFGMYVLPLGCQECRPLEHDVVYLSKNCPFCNKEKE